MQVTFLSKVTTSDGGKNDKELHKKILAVELVYPPHFSPLLRSLISSIMQYSSLSRPSCEQILEHGWFKQ